MLIVSSRKIKLEKILPIATKSGIGLVFFLGICFVFFMSLPLDKERHKGSLLPSPRGISSKLLTLSLETIGQGPLSLSPLKSQPILPDMSQEIQVLAKNIKPDRFVKQEDLLLSLKSSGLVQKVKSGELIFLSCDPLPGGTAPLYRFSDRKTPLWIRPSFLDANKVLVEVGLFMPSKESESFLEEKAQFILQVGAPSLSKTIQNSAWFGTLCQAKLWGSDLLLSRYGGEKYRSFKGKLKVEVPKERGSFFYFIEEGDTLVWHQGQWMDADKVDEIANKPLAQVKNLSSREVELEIWDEEGFYSQTVKLLLQNESKASAKPESFLQSVRMRTSHQVSCSFGKRRCLLKEGDWVLKTLRGWRILKRSIDLEDYFCHKLRGELYIFESLTKEQGKLVMKGTWVDEMRTQMRPFSVPVLGSAQTKSLTHQEKKSSLSKKAENSIEAQGKVK